MPTNAGPDPSAIDHLAKRALELFVLYGMLDQTLGRFNVYRSSLSKIEVWGGLRGDAFMENRPVVIWLTTVFALSDSPDQCRDLHVSVQPPGIVEDDIFEVSLSQAAEALTHSHPHIVSLIKQLTIGLRAKVLAHYVLEHDVGRT
jgi:hypothetical protein